MGYARHVGRVGALAVALGVGAAVASSPGIAYADPSEGGASSSDATSSTSAGESSSPKSAPKSSLKSSFKSSLKSALKSAANADADKTAKDIDTPAADEPAADGAADAAAPTDTEVADTEAPTDVVGAETPPVIVDEVLPPVVIDEGTPLVTPPVQDPVKGNDSGQDPTKGNSAKPPAAHEQATDVDATVNAADEVEQKPQASILAAVGEIATQLAADDVTTVAAASNSVVAPPAVPVRPKTLVGVVTEIVASVLQPLLNPGEGSPIQMPILSAALSLVRNEFERILAPARANFMAQQTVSLVPNPTPAPSVLADPTKPRVLVIAIDGANLSRILADDYNQNFFDLMGVSTTSASSIVGHTTISNPSWTAILTGVWGERTGVINNVFTPWTYNTWPTVFNQLESIDRDIQTVAVGNWDVINGIAGAGSIPADQNVFIGQVAGDKNWLATDDAVADWTVDSISGLNGPTPNFLFSYFVGVDENGHMYGAASEEYKLAIRNMDDNLGEILDAVAAREAMGEEWTVLVVTDHGHQPQVGLGHGFQSPAETGTFVIAEGTDFGDGLINPRYEIVDITPTVVSLFGGTPRAGSDGVSLTTLGGSDLDPVDLKQALKDAIATNRYPDIGTQVALGVRTVFASVPYYVLTFGKDIVAALPSFLSGPAQIVIDGLYVITNIPAQIVSFLTGVSGARIFPLLPPAPPAFTPEQDAILPDAVLMAGCGITGSVADSWCGTASVA
jgi:hypothetical protein